MRHSGTTGHHPGGQEDKSVKDTDAVSSVHVPVGVVQRSSCVPPGEAQLHQGGDGLCPPRPPLSLPLHQVLALLSHKHQDVSSNTGACSRSVRLRPLRWGYLSAGGDVGGGLLQVSSGGPQSKTSFSLGEAQVQEPGHLLRVRTETSVQRLHLSNQRDAQESIGPGRTPAAGPTWDSSRRA